MSDKITLSHRFENAVMRAILGSALLLPYKARVRFTGLAFSIIVAPLAGWIKRSTDNLALVYPEMEPHQKKRIARAVANNAGRTLIEIYSGEEFIANVKNAPISGPGLDQLNAARAAGRPIILVTAHLGNYDVVRSKLSREGFPMAALYRPMSNPLFHKHYLKAISTIATPVFPTDGKGIAGYIKHLREGGVVGILADIGSRKAPVLKFFGKPAHTPLSTAEWAVKYNALLVPVFGIRQADGLSFSIRIEAPIEHGEPADMMQAYNDIVEQVVREHPEQWFWIHRRWKK